MSPLTATLKCPRGRETLNGTEAVTAVACDEDGGGSKDHLEGGWGEARRALPAAKPDSESDPLGVNILGVIHCIKPFQLEPDNCWTERLPQGIWRLG